MTLVHGGGSCDFHTLERYAARTALRRESIEDSHRRGSEDDHDQTSRVSMEMNVRQLETLDRASKEKKTSSKIKKFFKKLSSHKKESSKQDDVIDHLSVTSRHDLRLPSSTDSEHSGGSSIGGDNRRFSGDKGGKNRDLVFKNTRHSMAASDDSAVLSSESLSSSQGGAGDSGFENCFQQQSNKTSPNSVAITRQQHRPSNSDNNEAANNSSLRTTPLRNSMDSYSRLLEVHRHTIDKIAHEVSRLVCTCAHLQGTDWNDYERNNDVIQLGVTGYTIVPVTCHKHAEQKNYTAWLRITDHQGDNIKTPHDTTQTTRSSSASSTSYTGTTLHRNCLHVCHTIEPSSPSTSPTETSDEQQETIQGVQTNQAFISTQSPKMTLARYIASSTETHALRPEVYERHTAIILLQIVKGVTHLVRHHAPLQHINAENIFLLDESSSSNPISSSMMRKTPKCPSVVVACLPTTTIVGGEDATPKMQPSTASITNLCQQIAFLLYKLLHSPFEEELKLIVNCPSLFATLPDLSIKSIYSRYLQSIIDKLLGAPQHSLGSLDELCVTLETILFGPSDICERTEREAVALIQKWHNRRCVDMVTYILKEAPLLMLCASDHHGEEVEKLKRADQEILLECEFLSSVMPKDIYRVSKELRR